MSRPRGGDTVGNALVGPQPRADEPAHVLVVEDEPLIREVLRGALGTAGVEVRTAETFAAACLAIGERVPDVLVADKNLPDGNGLDLARILKARDPIAECIVITGYPSLETAVAAIGHEVFDYLPKPFRDLAEVRARVHQALAKRGMALQNRRLVAELQAKNAALEGALRASVALQDELVRAERLAGIGTLAAGVAHEVNSPLLGVIGLAEAIVDERDPDVIRDHARDILAYGGRIRDIVRGLTAYARDDDEAVVVDAGAETHEAVRLVRRVVRCDGVSVRCVLASDVRVRARPGDIQQVALNLVRNAVESVQGGGRHGEVRVVLEQSAGQVRLRVEDDGPGVDEEARRHVFDPFYTTKAAGQGTGLGLHVCYRIALRMGGTLSLVDASGRGAAFELRVPSVGVA